jgi:hypothetical protein
MPFNLPSLTSVTTIITLLPFCCASPSTDGADPIASYNPFMQITAEGKSSKIIAYFVLHIINFVFLLNSIILVGFVYKFDPMYVSSHLAYSLLFFILTTVYVIMLFFGRKMYLH